MSWMKAVDKSVNIILGRPCHKVQMFIISFLVKYNSKTPIKIL